MNHKTLKDKDSKWDNRRKYWIQTVRYADVSKPVWAFLFAALSDNIYIYI